MDLERIAIERIRTASEMSLKLYGKPLIITDSGGKDSTVCRELARRAGVVFEVSHSHTTADAPPTVYYVRNTFRKLEEKGIKCTIHRPEYRGRRITMWTLIPMKRFPPTRLQRYCCEILKESYGKNRFITTGVRWDESRNRRNKRGIYENETSDPKKKIILNNDNDDRRMLFENCAVKGKRICNPIIDWTTADIWDYIRCERLEVNPLYEMGFFRVGCLGCPLVGKRRWKEFRLFPTYKQAYIRAFGQMLDEIHIRGIETKWKSAQEVFSWWMEEDVIEGQIKLEDLAEWKAENRVN